MNPSDFDKLQNRIVGYGNDVIRIQKMLTACPALSPENGGDGEERKAEIVKKLLDETGYDKLLNVDAPDTRVSSGIRPNFIVRWNGHSNQKTIWIMSHMDIVPPGDLTRWDHDPYDAVLKDGKIIGRGTEDNQQAIVSSLLAIRALRSEGLVPEYDVGFAIVSDEETGSTFGIEHVLNTRPDLFCPQDLIVIPDAGDPEGTVIETAEKSILWIRFEIHGKQTHGSTPEKGSNAHKAGAHLIVRMNDLYKQYPKNNPLFDPPVSTFEPTKKENNVPNINTIPGDDVFYFDCRVLPEVVLEEIQNRIRVWADEIQQQFQVQIQITWPQRVQAPPSTPVDAPVVQALIKAVKAVMGREGRTLGIGGGTVAAHFRERGLHAVCWTCLDDVAHAPNEYSRIENTLNDAKVFAHLFLQK